MTNAPDLDAFIEGVSTQQIALPPDAAPLIFDCAAQGDIVALDLLQWAGRELAEMVLAVARQLDLQKSNPDVVLIGSLFKGRPSLQPILYNHLIHTIPNANLIQLIGAVRLAMEHSNMTQLSIINALSHMKRNGK
jgi:N-acetylglucosamine kinase-like BadF-type ATPase